MKVLHLNYIPLADILANGVAVLLILIVLSLNIKQQNSEKEVEQVSQIGSVMSREIASSLVTNALPSSAPAMLHDYNHPRKANTPRIIMYKNHLLIKDAGDGKPLDERLSREELLQQNNRLDVFLEQLGKLRKKRIRMDVIGIKNYYLVLSILKKHQAHIMDWHFAGDANAVGGGDYLLSDYQEKNSAQTQAELAEELPPTIDVEQGRLTQSVDFSMSKGNEFFSGKYETELGAEYGYEQGMDGDSTIDDRNMSAEMIRLFQQYLGQEDAHFVESLNISFSGGGQISAKDINKQQANTQDGSMPASKQLLAFLLGYLSNRQHAYQAGDFVQINAKDFMTRQLKSLYQDYKAQIESLYANISAFKAESISIQHQYAQIPAVLLLVNQHLQGVVIKTQKDVKPELFEHNKLSIKLYPQPTINQGLVVDINDTDVVLFAHKHNQNKQFDWQLVAVLDAELSDVKIGFIHAKYSKDGLLLSNQENNVHINQRAIKQYYLSSNTHNYWKWGLLIVILMVFLQLLYKRNND